MRALVDERPTDGYRRITALVSRELGASRELLAHQQRLYPVEKAHGLLLTRHAGRRPGRLHNGKVVAMRSNLRGCLDALELTCCNGENVRVAFIIDAYDREIVAGRAVAGAGIGGSPVRDMRLEAVETRFGSLQAPHKVEFLTDNASLTQIAR